VIPRSKSVYNVCRHVRSCRQSSSLIREVEIGMTTGQRRSRFHYPCVGHDQHPANKFLKKKYNIISPAVPSPHHPTCKHANSRSLSCFALPPRRPGNGQRRRRSLRNIQISYGHMNKPESNSRQSSSSNAAYDCHGKWPKIMYECRFPCSSSSPPLLCGYRKSGRTHTESFLGISERSYA